MAERDAGSGDGRGDGPDRIRSRSRSDEEKEEAKGEGDWGADHGPEAEAPGPEAEAPESEAPDPVLDFTWKSEPQLLIIMSGNVEAVGLHMAECHRLGGTHWRVSLDTNMTEYMILRKTFNDGQVEYGPYR